MGKHERVGGQTGEDRGKDRSGETVRDNCRRGRQRINTSMQTTGGLEEATVTMTEEDAPKLKKYLSVHTSRATA